MRAFNYAASAILLKERLVLLVLAFNLSLPFLRSRLCDTLIKSPSTPGESENTPRFGSIESILAQFAHFVNII